MTRCAFLACILALVTYTVEADVLNQFVLPGSQCATAVSIDANGRIATSLIDQNGAGVFLFNPDLTLRFNKRFSSSGRVDPNGIVPTADGGFVVAGTISMPSGDTDAIVYKVSSTGNIVWKKVFGTAENDQLHSATALPDGSIAVLGHRISASTSHDLLIARFSKGGALLWRKVLGTPSVDHVGSITSASGPALMVSAGTGTTIQPLWIKLSLSGAVLSARVASTPESLAFFYMENPNGGYYLGSGGLGQLAKTNISRFDATDRLVWAKSYSFSGNTLTLHPGFVNPDGSMVLAGNSGGLFAAPPPLRGVVMKISSSGGVQWKRALNIAQSDFISAVQQTDGNIFAAGCIAANTNASDVVALSLPISGNTGGCSSLTSAPISAAGTTMTLRNFSIGVLPATFRTQTLAIQSASAQPEKSAVCP